MGHRRGSNQAVLPDWATNPRKQRTETILLRRNIPVNPWLPRIETEEEVSIRTPGDVARRVIVLHVIASAAHDDDASEARKFLQAKGLWQSVTPNERRLFENDVADAERVRASWRVEAAWALLWALGKLPDLGWPQSTCGGPALRQALPTEDGIADFIDVATLRSPSEILDETDRIYRIHWAVRESILRNAVIPANLHPGVVAERHTALNWLTCYADEWDDVTADT